MLALLIGSHETYSLAAPVAHATRAAPPAMVFRQALSEKQTAAKQGWYYGKVVPTAGFQATMGDNEIGRRAKLSSSDEAATRDSAPVVAAAEKSWYYAEPFKANSAYTPAFGDNA
ncbi:hypothetical protein EMIHUDRAFT_465904 [Emiliania huxleyi CCMP1516]|uniref:Uncharacterized protein n=2 Tax=Emiliania huxleyi TaxID=2903 RepID=A0A0D3I485_EMIH1|nr:hypothetical protein EMIHUDRAFT_465904 [Emiliania huxleyi CCMP1516]EOD06070.1 hypothetical protein EMIHUDRAFT_465904 [Emiliania huxleyi CCMP1516]|eukprot:XP_005758499.1 hypothetical protein EMIHUDRAFT_465904 [Emiliania huxleyi CCMP1516]